MSMGGVGEDTTGLHREFGQGDAPDPLAVDQGPVHVEEHGGRIHRTILRSRRPGSDRL